MGKKRKVPPLCTVRNIIAATNEIAGYIDGYCEEDRDEKSLIKYATELHDFFRRVDYRHMKRYIEGNFEGAQEAMDAYLAALGRFKEKYPNARFVELK